MLVQDAKFLLLDEPFNAVDARTTYALLEVLRQCHQDGQAVIAVLHDYEQERIYSPPRLATSLPLQQILKFRTQISYNSLK